MTENDVTLKFRQPGYGNSLASFVEEQAIRHFQAQMKMCSMYTEKDPVKREARCRELAKLANIRILKNILRSPFSWAPRLVIWVAYWITTPLKDELIFCEDHPTDAMLRRAGL